MISSWQPSIAGKKIWHNQVAYWSYCLGYPIADPLHLRFERRRLVLGTRCFSSLFLCLIISPIYHDERKYWCDFCDIWQLVENATCRYALGGTSPEALSQDCPRETLTGLRHLRQLVRISNKSISGCNNRGFTRPINPKWIFKAELYL